MKHEPIIILLTPIESRIATLVGEIRTQSSKARGMPDKHGFTGDGLQNDIVGSKGECGLSKHLNVFWCGSLDTFKLEKDVGSFFEVRSVGELNRRLIVREDDDDNAYFVLVAVVNDTCYIKGFLLGKEAKKGKYLKDYNDREPAYFVPDDQLRDPKELKDLYLQIL